VLATEDAARTRRRPRRHRGAKLASPRLAISLRFSQTAYSGVGPSLGDRRASAARGPRTVAASFAARSKIWTWRSQLNLSRTRRTAFSPRRRLHAGTSEEGADLSGEVLQVVRSREQSGLAVLDRYRGSTVCPRDDGKSVGHRFEDAQPEIFTPATSRRRPRPRDRGWPSSRSSTSPTNCT
jgi:hypothetical protein